MIHGSSRTQGLNPRSLIVDYRRRVDLDFVHTNVYPIITVFHLVMISMRYNQANDTGVSIVVSTYKYHNR